MKKYLIIASLGLMAVSSCKKDKDFLKEVPIDFLTIDNALLNYAQFKTALNDEYRLVRYNYNYRDQPEDFFHFGVGTDVLVRPVNDGDRFTDWSIVNEQSTIFDIQWQRNYVLINESNNILKAMMNPEVNWRDSVQKNQVEGEARFFRGYAYRYLSFGFGGVPILLEPSTEPKLDYTRASRADVYRQAIEDFNIAASKLPQTTNEPGRLVKAAAYHHLAEMYIALGDETNDASNYDKAVQAASMVIDGQVGDYHLMTERFGWMKNTPGKNVFWDMFQMRNPDNSYSNYNYQSGNKEAIWVMQVDNFISGGLGDALPTRTDQERAYWPSFWALKKFGYNGGPARDWTGRGVSFVRPTNFFTYELYNSTGPDDIRNQPSTLQRVFFAAPPIINGVEDPTYDTTYVDQITLANGQTITVETHPGDTIRPEWLTTRQDTMERVFPRVMKMGSEWHYNGDPSNGFAQESYAIRLAETYLVRAEAYMKAGNLAMAAEDINAIRTRAHATLVSAGDVNIDLILDERARELFGEELRTLTLTRLGLLYDRTKRYGYSASQATVQERNNLFPIPQSVIDANSQAEFPQNPGY